MDVVVSWGVVWVELWAEGAVNALSGRHVRSHPPCSSGEGSLLLLLVCMLVCQTAGWRWIEGVAYPVEGGGCDAELRVVVLMGATCLFQAGGVVCEIN